MLKEFNLYYVLTAKDILKKFSQKTQFFLYYGVLLNNTVWYNMYYIS